MSKARDLDQFYTNPILAKKLIHKLDLSEFENVIEPSAGAGYILDCLPEKTRSGLDIDPKRSDIFKINFFDFKPPEGKTAYVGNPPFGNRNTLSKAFVEKITSHDNSELVAFVLPRVWEKHTLQKSFPRDWKLIHSEILPENSFLLEGKPYNVHCVWQVWSKTSNLKDLRWDEEPEITHDDFDLVNGDDYDFLMMGASPRNLKDPSEVSLNNRGYKFKCNIPVEDVKKKINNVPWEEVGCSSVNGGVYWITTPELIKHYKGFNND